MPQLPSKLPQFHVVGFSGHRRVHDAPAIASAVREALSLLRREAPGHWLALSSIAVGSDAVFAREVIAADIGWHVILPLPPGEFRKDFSDSEWRDVEALLAEAEQVKVVAENGTRDDAYLDGGIETVNGCDVLVAVWDGQPAHGRGGTGDVVAYARELRKPMLLIDAATFALRRENFDRFEPNDHHLVYFNSLPDAPPPEGENVFHALAPIFRFQRKVDVAASHGAPQFRRLIAGTVLLHVLATLVAAAGLSFGIHVLALPWIKFLCLLAALGVALMLRYARSHHNWVRCRFAAEVARSALATWGLPRSAPLFEEPEIAEYRPLMRSLHILHRRAAAAQPMPLDEFKQLYRTNRIDDQLAYYRRRLALALPAITRLRAGFWVATVLAIACTAGYTVGETLHWEWVSGFGQELIFYFLPISAPVVAAAFISLISINDLHRRVARYREMVHLLQGAHSQIGFCHTWNSLERVVEKTERALLQEVLEWHSIANFSESH